jgi:hypothetical protein
MQMIVQLFSPVPLWWFSMRESRRPVGSGSRFSILRSSTPIGRHPTTATLSMVPEHGPPGRRRADAASDALEHVEKVMRGGRVRRLPVVSEGGSLAGMISLADLAREAARESAQSQKQLTETDVGDTLATICMNPVHSLAA